MPPPLLIWGDTVDPLDVTADLGAERRDQLLSALRRRDLADVRHALHAWAEDDIIVDEDALEADDFIWQRPLWDELTAWLHREIGLHVEAGRFEHALCLLERYAFPPAILSKAQLLLRDKESS